MTARNNALGLSLISAAAILSAVSLWNFPLPYAWIFLTWSIVLIYASISARESTRRAVWLNTAVATIVLTGFEFYFGTDSEEEYCDPEIVPDVYTTDDLLGWTLLRDVRGSAVCSIGGEDIYRVTYTTGPDGLRISPPSRDSHYSILFFGGSYTMGQGVEDQETLPSLVAQKTAGMFRTYNFGVSGYGPHHMLAALESGLVDRVVADEPRLAIYLAIPDHVNRAAGRKDWDTNGPRYVLASDGTTRFEGQFDDVWDVHSAIVRILRKSYIVQRLLPHLGEGCVADFDLFGAIVASSRTIIKNSYPNSEFHVILWAESEDEETNGRVLNSLEQLGIIVHLVSDFVPDIEDGAKYRLDQREGGHPTTFAYDRFADYIVDEVLRDRTPLDGTAE